MRRPQTERLVEEIARDWGDRLSRVRVRPSLTHRTTGWRVRARDGRTGKPFTWAMWRDWVRWKAEQRRP